jgi:hypothetical protein
MPGPIVMAENKHMNLLTGINYPAVLISAAIYYVIGFLWYTKLFGKIWRKENGMTDEPASKPSPGALIGQFISTFLFTLGIAIIMKLEGVYGITGGVSACVLITVFFVIPINSGNLFFTGKKKLFLLNVVERALGSLVAGIIIGLWQ